VTALELIQQLESGTPHPVNFLYGEEDFFSEGTHRQADAPLDHAGQPALFFLDKIRSYQ